MQIYFVDYENVGPSRFKNFIHSIENCSVFVFYSGENNSINFDDLAEVDSIDFKFMKIYNCSKNALDFQLASYLGYLINHEKNIIGSDDNQYFIVSDDKEYECLSKFWLKQNINVNIIKISDISVFDDKNIETLDKNTVESVDKNDNKNIAIDSYMEIRKDKKFNTELKNRAVDLLMSVLSDKTKCIKVLAYMTQSASRQKFEDQVKKLVRKEKKYHQVLDIIYKSKLIQWLGYMNTKSCFYKNK